MWIKATKVVLLSKNKLRFIDIDNLQEAIYRLKKCIMPVIEYFTQMKIIWDELENFSIILVCKCFILCTCVALQQARARSYNSIIQMIE
ncbi:hypothetical protein CR513_10344, partial [Mucuna pruriens]